MQKTFRLNSIGDKYKVLISRKLKVNINTGKEQINFFFGNQSFVNAELEYLTNFLEHRLCLSKADEIKSYILNNI